MKEWVDKWKGLVHWVSGNVALMEMLLFWLKKRSKNTLIEI